MHPVVLGLNRKAPICGRVRLRGIAAKSQIPDPLPLNRLRSDRILIVYEVRVIAATLKWCTKAQLCSISTRDYFVESLADRLGICGVVMFLAAQLVYYSRCCSPIVRLFTHREGIVMPTLIQPVCHHDR